MRTAWIKKHRARHLINVYSDNWFHLVHVLSWEQSSADILSPSLFPRQFEAMCSILPHWKQHARPHLLSVQSLAMWPIRPQGKKFTLACGDLYGHSGPSAWPLQPAPPDLLHPYRWPVLVSVFWMLVDAPIVVSTEPGVQPWTLIQKSVQVILQTEQPTFFSAATKTSTVLPAINVQVVKRLYTVQESIAKALYNAALGQHIDLFHCW